MKRKGFTLVELLGILSILAIITLITVPSVNYIINQGKEKSYDAQIKSIKLALNDYYSDNKHTLDQNTGVSLTLEQLKHDNYIDFEFRNPKTNKCFSNKSTFFINMENGNKEFLIENLTDGEEKDCNEFYDSPSIILNGSSHVTLELGDIYLDQGYKAYDEDGSDITNIVSVDNNINYNQVGMYEVFYNVSENNLMSNVTRSVEVIDSKPPTIQGIEPIILEVANNDFDMMDGIIISDNSNQEIDITTTSNLAVGVPGQYYVDYILTDPSNNVTRKRRLVTVYDTVILEPHTL